MAASVTGALQMQMPGIFRDTLMSTVVPMFDKTLRLMFNQVNETFSRGTRERKFTTIYIYIMEYTPNNLICFEPSCLLFSHNTLQYCFLNTYNFHRIYGNKVTKSLLEYSFSEVVVCRS